jgi:hypothetical protein
MLKERRLPKITPIRPNYAERFRCIGSACDDTCCKGWSVPIDRAAYEKYQELPASPLRTLILTNFLVAPESAERKDCAGGEKPGSPATGPGRKGEKPGPFAIIRMNESNQCPLLSEDRLCRIHAELGEELLSYTCATYPRIEHSVGGIEDTALALSCPEAARLVLLTPDLFKEEAAIDVADMHTPRAEAAVDSATADAGAEKAAETLIQVQGSGISPYFTSMTSTRALAPEGGFSRNSTTSFLFTAARKSPADDSDPALEDSSSSTGEVYPSLAIHFWPIREPMLALVRSRAYPLWQRLFLMSLLCRRLDSIAKGELKRSVPAFLADFEATVATGALRQAMETLPVDTEAQLDAVLRLAGMMLHRSNVTPRFAACVQAFTAGIGNGPGATLQSLTAQYTLAHDRHYAPFLIRYPHIMENYLINTISRCQFPFGREGLLPGARPSTIREFALLTAQFALMRGLLIGVAGFHGEGFSPEHAVHTVQAASKHFEHHPEFLNMAQSLLAESGLDGARGLAILLRNARPASPRPGSQTIDVPGPQTGTEASSSRPLQAPGSPLPAPPFHPQGARRG